MKYLSLQNLLVLSAILNIAVFTLLNTGCREVREARDVANEQVGPRALLKKYEWFKDMAAALDKKVADVDLYINRVKNIEDSYLNKDRTTWARDDREAHRQAQNELVGVKTSYNLLAQEYNAAMAKENYRFCEVGRLPEGASKPLPREYKPYMDK